MTNPFPRRPEAAAPNGLHEPVSISSIPFCGDDLTVGGLLSKLSSLASERSG